MDDGHTGLENNKVNEGGSGVFKLILAYLKQRGDEGQFFVHATSDTHYTFGLQPFQFLENIGFSNFSGHCPFHSDKCYYREIAKVKNDRTGLIVYERDVESIHQRFLLFAGGIGRLYELFQEEDKLLRHLSIGKYIPNLLGDPLTIKIKETSMPTWVECIKPERLKNLENELKDVNDKIEDLRGFLPLVYGTGDDLENAVLKSLKLLHLDVNKTEHGFTADILAKTVDGSANFGIEVTGIENAIRKKSEKLTQVLEFERIKENNEKTILIANTHRKLPVDKRKELDDFTLDVVNFLSPYPILLMTGLDLYRIVCDILEEKKKPEEIIQLLIEARGILEYS